MGPGGAGARDGATGEIPYTTRRDPIARPGEHDRLDEELARFSRDFGIPMPVWWRSDIDARVDAAPTELKWAYSDMLAGHDLVRYFIHGAQAAA